jgi:hypothetical protein
MKGKKYILGMAQIKVKETLQGKGGGLCSFDLTSSFFFLFTTETDIR